MQSESSRPWGSSIATILTFLALGPPLGAIVLVLLLTLMPGLAMTSSFADKGAADMLAGSFGMMLFALPFSYIVGGLQAGFCGLVVAIFGCIKGKPPLWIALAASAIAFLVFFGFDVFGTLSDTKSIIFIMLIVHLVPTTLCWLIVRTYWRVRG